ncbi:MAG: GAF domain-containing protein [Anaerolineales bacterium]|jgi:signal transduction histidine kinase
MAMSLMEVRLKETSQLTGAAWAAWLEREAEGWEVHAAYQLNRQLAKALLAYLDHPGVEGWISRAMQGKQNRPRPTPPEIGLPGEKIFVFPDQMTQRLVLVGADQLSKAALRFWRVVALGNSGRSPFDLATPPVPANPEFGLGIPFYLPQALDQILGVVLHSVPSEGAWLAVRSGDVFEIKAVTNCPDCAGKRIPIEANPLLREFSQTHIPRIVNKGRPEWAMVPRTGFRPATRVWAGLPLVIGQRLIGLIGLWSESPFLEDDWKHLVQESVRVAPAVEGSITFSDITNHLQRMALLNDFAMTVSSAFDLEQIVQRTFALLRRAFETDRINLFLMASDGNTLYHYFERDEKIRTETHTTGAGDPARWGVERGEVFRAETFPSDSKYEPLYPDTQSALIVPLKFRRQVIGSLNLESQREGAFTVYDEHLLVVIASHLAGLIENGRLRQEAESRARNLSLIHEVVEQIIGLTDVRQVVQIAAELMARNFAYELVMVVLAENPQGEPWVMGIGGSAADVVQHALRHMKQLPQGGITARAAATGQSLLVSDVTKNPIYQPIADWIAGSEMCVPLREGEQILGVIDVESQRKNAFSPNDLLVLEALAGILSSVISNVGQYEKLQATVNQLQLARKELQERITAQRVAESRLVQAGKLAAVGEMAAGIAHELNNPLTTVTGFAELVMDELPEGSSARTDLELVLREANRASGVVRRLLDFARQNESVRSRTDPNEIVTDVLALVNHLLHTSGVRVTPDLGERLPWISVDRNQIKQVVLNLVHNALHAMPAGGELHITTGKHRREKRDWLTIRIQDSGTGIPAENLEHIFEPFFTTRSKEGGTGLGLSVSYGIVADHGGFIEVESTAGKGSTFNVWLPIEVE